MHQANFWWSLPGPSGFLDKVEQDLVQGRNIVLALPPFHPAGLADALADRPTLRDDLFYETLDLREALSTAPPARLIHEALAPIRGSATVPSAQALLEVPQLQSTVVWVEGVDQQAWPRWREFIDTYQHLSRHVDEHRRLLFCIAVTGRAAEHLPNPDVALNVHRWEGVVGWIDMLLYTARLFDNRPWVSTHRRLAMNIVAELAGTDPRVAEVFAEAELSQILEPFPVLREMARQRCWLNSGAPPEPRWCDGTLDRLDDGKAHVHAALDAVRADSRHLSRRLWRGQVGVLFPFLEETRVRIARKLRHQLTSAHDGAAPDAEHFELAEIKARLSRSHVDGSIKAALDRCVRMRNELAHLRPVAAADVLAEDVTALAGSAVPAHTNQS